MMRTINKLVVFVSLVVVTLTLTAKANKVYADCEDNYGGGETCIYNKSFDIEKKVRVLGDDDWEDDEITGAETDETFEFRIRIKNTGEIEVDNMKMEDKLPDGFDRVGGSGLTEYWDDFEPGETKEFRIEAEFTGDLDDYDSDCFPNTGKVYWDGNKEGSDVATVCFGEGEVTELPETGAGASIALAFAGLGLISLGTLSRKKLSR